MLPQLLFDAAYDKSTKILSGQLLTHFSTIEDRKGSKMVNIYIAKNRLKIFIISSKSVSKINNSKIDSGGL